MFWPNREPDPTADPAALVVLEAFDAAKAARLPAVICYRAGVEAWRRAHPDQRPEYAAKQAVPSSSRPRSACASTMRE
jgi:hypothetical protein